jgi:hypothetical protein
MTSATAAALGAVATIAFAPPSFASAAPADTFAAST